MTGAEFMAAPRMRLALSVLAIGVLTAGWVTMNAIRPVDIQAKTAAAIPTVDALKLPPQSDPINPDEVAATDIFSPGRKPSRNRFKLPNEKDAAPPTQNQTAKPTVVGTVMNTDNPKLTFASCALSTGRVTTPTKVYVGDNCGKFTVVSIDKLSVRFRTPAGDTIEIFRTGSR